MGRSDGRSPIYPWSAWNLASFPIDAEYDDYGQYDFDEDGEAFKGFLNYLEKNAVTVEQGENEYHDHPFDPSNPKHLTYDHIKDVIHSGRLAVTDAMGNKCNVQVFPVLNQVWEDVCMTEKVEDFVGTITTLDTLYQKKLQTIKDSPIGAQASIDGKEVRLEELLAEMEAKTDQSEQDHDLLMALRLMKKYENFEPNISNSTLGLAIDEFASKYNFKYHYDSKGAEWLASAVAEISMLQWTLMEINSPIYPSMYGGQEGNYEYTAKFHERCAKIANDIEQKYREEDD